MAKLKTLNGKRKKYDERPSNQAYNERAEENGAAEVADEEARGSGKRSSQEDHKQDDEKTTLATWRQLRG